MKNNEQKGWPSGFEPIDQRTYRVHQLIISSLQKVSTLFGYDQMQTPRVVDLSWVETKNAGSQEIKKEMFNLNRVGQMEPGSMVLAFEHTLSLAKYLSFQGQQAVYPFRRMEVGPVYRGERAQKGRKREFVQADIDVVGLREPWGEVEVVSIMGQMLDLLSFPEETKVHYNDRKLLVNLIGIIDQTTNPDVIKAIMRQIDKLDKVPLEKVVEEAIAKNIPVNSIKEIVGLSEELSKINNPILAVKQFTDNLKAKNLWGQEIEKALDSMSTVFSLLGEKACRVTFNPRLVRGLDYYTGSIFEIHDPRIGYSLCGGGRYDNLIEDIGGPKDMAAIGFAFGIDRMVLAMETLGINTSASQEKGLAILTFGDNTTSYTLQVGDMIREMGIKAVVINPDKLKLKDQLKQASDGNYRYCVIIGDNEVDTQTVTLRNMEIRDQSNIALVDLKERLSKLF